MGLRSLIQGFGSSKREHSSASVSPSRAPANASTRESPTAGQSPTPIHLKAHASEYEGKSRDLWDEAYVLLCQEDPKLQERYEEILLGEDGDSSFGQNHLAPVGSFRREEQLRALAKKKVEEVDLGQWRINVHGRSLGVSEEFDKAVKIIVSVKDFVSSAVSSEPHAALAWAGVCVFLPLLVNPSEQKSAAREGLDTIPFAVRRLRVMERLVRSRVSESTGAGYKEDSLDLVRDFEHIAIHLYKTILDFQIRLLRQYSGKWAVRYGREIFKTDDWAALTKQIQALEIRCTEIASDLGRERIESALQASDRTLQRGMQDVQQELKRTANEIEKQTIMQSTWRQTDEERNCVQLFRHSNPYENQKNRTAKRVLETGKWFLENQNFLNWRDNDGPDLLWLSAKPGSGKSVIARTLVDEGLVISSKQTNTAVCYFFFKDISPYQRSAHSAIAAILHQIFSTFPPLVKYALLAFSLNGKEILQLFDEMFEILCQASADSSVGQVVCVLDALDECSDGDRNMLIEKITNFYHKSRRSSSTEGQPKLKFLLTSRPYSNIHSQFNSLIQKAPVIHLSGDHESQKIKEEIDNVISDEVPKLAAAKGYDDEATDFLMGELLAVDNRTYLWLSLIMEEIRFSERPANKRELFKIISALPKSLIDAFDANLKRCRHPELARQIFHIILAAREPLSVEDMKVATALAADFEYHSYEEIGLERTDVFEMRIKNVCGLMVTIDNGSVFLIHQAVKDFLVSTDEEKNSGVWKNSFSPIESERLMGKVCITLLSFNCFSETPLDIADDNVEAATLKVFEYIADHPFLEYSSTQWTDHAQGAKLDENASWMPSILSLCNVRGPGFRTWYTIWNQKLGKRFPSQTTSLNIAVIFGFLNVLASFLESGENPNEPDGHGATPLARGVSKSKKAVELLLNAKADINTREWEEPWHSEVDEDGDEIKVKPFSGTPLVMAVYQGDIELVKLLIDRGARVNYSPGSSFTPLGAACMCFIECGNLGSDATEILRLLVYHAANVSFEEEVYCLGLSTGTALHLGACMLDPSILELFLESDTAQVNCQATKWVLTVIFHEPNTDDEASGSEASKLRSASWKALPALRNVELTQTQKAIEVCTAKSESLDGTSDGTTSWEYSSGQPSLYGATPLHLAVGYGFVENVELLLEHGADPYIKERSGLTALDIASSLTYNKEGNHDDEANFLTMKNEIIRLLGRHK